MLSSDLLYRSSQSYGFTTFYDDVAMFPWTQLVIHELALMNSI